MKKTLLGLLGFGSLFAASANAHTPTPPTEIQQPEKSAVIPNRSKLPNKMEVPPMIYSLYNFLPSFDSEEHYNNLISKRNPRRKVRVQARW